MAQHTSENQSKEEGKEEKHHHTFFEKGSITLGVGAALSSELGTVGINGRLYYNIGEHICFGPEFTYFKKNEIELYDMDFVFHYIFETPIVGIYPVVGLNYTIEKELDHHHEEDAFGVLWGVGVHRNIKNITILGEFTRVESSLSDSFVSLAILYTF
ncbi:hypothetical protein [Sediminitomix flava]|nr:hypothetical protein [Sediminitomix flava]